MSGPVVFEIPNTLRNWPWPRHCNPNYEACKAESAKWCASFGAFSPKAQKAFDLCDFNLLASVAYPLLNKEGCRIGCDLMNLFFVIDEYTDIATAEVARQQADIIMDALRNPHTPRPAGEWIGGEVARSFWENAVKTATPSAQRRFIEKFGTYTDSVVQQALDRDNHMIRGVEDYFEVRRDTIGAKPSFAINEVHLNIPDEVMEHPVLKVLHSTCIDMLCIGNDICSWNVEQAKNDDLHNLVTIVIHHQKVDVHGAMAWIGELHDKLVDEFLDAYKQVPSFAYLGKTEEEGKQIDADVAIYVDGLGNWVRGNDVWSFESQRYFGTKGMEIDQTRMCQLLPKIGTAPSANDPDFTPAVVDAPVNAVTTK